MLDITTTADRLKAFLVQEGLRNRDRNDMLRAFCEELVNAGVPLLRMQLAQRAFHPEFGGIGFTWTRADGMSHEYFGRPDGATSEWVQSPFYYLIDNALADMVVDLNGPDADRFPIFADLRAMGGTGYYANWQPLGDVAREDCEAERLDSEGVIASWTCDGADGMDPAHTALISACIETLVVVLAQAGNRQMGADLLRVYLGRDAGDRVLSGEIQRGSSRHIDAVICLFDLRSFTALAETLPGTEVVTMLNDYFGHVVEIIQSRGGNILKFLGDGVLAMFDVGTLQQDVDAALCAVKQLYQRLELINQERAAAGLPYRDYNLTLHAGEILYGNIGAENRLDFTVIGPTVNLTSRIADMHRSLEQPILLSEEVSRAASPDRDDLISVGRYMLRGVGQPMELFTIYCPECEEPACAGASDQISS